MLTGHLFRLLFACIIIKVSAKSNIIIKFDLIEII